jgi:hypothetical protein
LLFLVATARKRIFASQRKEDKCFLWFFVRTIASQFSFLVFLKEFFVFIFFVAKSPVILPAKLAG